MPRIRRGGKRIRDSSGLRTRNDECCCCDCETDGPQASFDYEVTNNDPCTFDFTSSVLTSEACGDIVSYLWEVDDVEFSTAANPTAEEFAGDGPWTVRLTVVDENGCEDVVEGDVFCYLPPPSGCNDCTDGTIPGFVTLVVSGFTDGTCDTCSEMNGTHILAFDDYATGLLCCRYQKFFSTLCDPPGGAPKGWIAQITCSYDPLGPTAAFNAMVVNGNWDNALGGASAQWFKAWPTEDECIGTHTLDLGNVFDTAPDCNPPATVQLII
jgi:hypothetical protein